jgi:hypothetical protein
MICSISLSEEQNIYAVHVSARWGHSGIKGTRFAYAQETGQFVPQSIIAHIVSHCEACQVFKSDRRGRKNPSLIVKKLSEIGKDITINITGPFKFEKKITTK